MAETFDTQGFDAFRFSFRFLFRFPFRFSVFVGGMGKLSEAVFVGGKLSVG